MTVAPFEIAACQPSWMPLTSRLGDAKYLIAPLDRLEIACEVLRQVRFADTLYIDVWLNNGQRVRVRRKRSCPA